MRCDVMPAASGGVWRRFAFFVSPRAEVVLGNLLLDAARGACEGKLK